jgi:uncharacterized CHY-type Zn-finger protein
MNACFEFHFPADVLERYAMGKVSHLDCGPLEEHLILCAACRKRLMHVEEFISVIRVALMELDTHPEARICTQSAFAL